MVRRLQVEGAADFDGVHYLRALGNADSIRRDAEEAERVLLVGGSYIGCEVAASLTALGKQCTILMQESQPMERAFGPQAGRFVRAILERRGIEIVGDDEVERFTGADERVTAVVTKDGRELAAEVVVCGVGARPDLMLARKAGLEIGERGGVRCDRRLETSFSGIYAAGDMCEYDSVLHGTHIRIEHEDVAETQGETAARNMLAADETYAAVPYFWSDLADWVTLEYVGAAQSWDREVLRVSPEDGEFTISYLEGNRLVGALAVDRGADLAHARRLIAAGGHAPELADPEADFSSLANAAS